MIVEGESINESDKKIKLGKDLVVDDSSKKNYFKNSQPNLQTNPGFLN